MSDTSKAAAFFYETKVGRSLLKAVMTLRLDRFAAAFLRSTWSKPLNEWYIRRHNIQVGSEEKASFRSFRDLFARTRGDLVFDKDPNHLISPCDGLLSSFPIDEDSSFSIKHSRYGVGDFLKDEDLAKNYLGGTCLVFRLCPSDYHHYCYVDDGYQGKNHPIPGLLHSVQPVALDAYPVFVLNRRSWCLLVTEHFGPVVQCEVGALMVGGIFNANENTRFSKGDEKGRFELAGSTIVLLFEAEQMQLRQELLEKLSHSEEVRVKQGEWIGTTGGSGSWAAPRYRNRSCPASSRDPA